MTPTQNLRLPIFAAILAVLAATRLNHFGAIPDASWAMFFVAGFYLRDSVRWAFPALMVLAVAVDWFGIAASGASFAGHYCVSPGYALLLPAYFSLWAAGALVARHGMRRPGANTLALLVAAVFAGTAVCHFFAQGGFYWLSDVVAGAGVDLREAVAHRAQRAARPTRPAWPANCANATCSTVASPT